MYQKREIYRSIAELAYAVAKSQNGLQTTERDAFIKIIEKELNFDAWVAKSRFDILDSKIAPTIDEAYNAAIFELKKYKDYFNEEDKHKAVKVLRKVAESYRGVSHTQEALIEKFEKQIFSL